MRCLAFAALLVGCGLDSVPLPDSAGMLVVTTTSQVRVTSEPPAIDCGNGGAVCVSAFPAGTKVTLHVTEIPATCDVSVFVVDDSSFPRCKTFSAQCQFDVGGDEVQQIEVSCTTYP